MVETRDQAQKTLGDRIQSFRRLNVDSLGATMAKIMVSPIFRWTQRVDYAAAARAGVPVTWNEFDEF